MDTEENQLNNKYNELFKLSLELQTEEMEKYKWIQSEKVGHDVGKSIYLEWISLYGKSFRDHFDNEYIKKEKL